MYRLNFSIIRLFTSLVIALGIVAAASKIDRAVIVSSANPIQPKSLFTASTTNEIVSIVKCVIDVIDGISNEYRCQSVWIDLQHKLRESINSLFQCLGYKGFQYQGCLIKNVVSIGWQINGFITQLDTLPDAGKQLRIRIPQKCSDRKL